jgi:hypothetical protein
MNKNHLIVLGVLVSIIFIATSSFLSAYPFVEIKTIEEILDNPIEGEEVYVEGRFEDMSAVMGTSLICPGEELGPKMSGLNFQDKSGDIGFAPIQHDVFEILSKQQMGESVTGWIEEGGIYYFYIKLKADIRLYEGPTGCQSLEPENRTVVYLDIREIYPKPSWLQQFYHYLWGGTEKDRDAVENLVRSYSGEVECKDSGATIEAFVGNINDTYADVTYRINSEKIVDRKEEIFESCSASYSFELKRENLIWSIVNVSLKNHTISYSGPSIGRVLTESEFIGWQEIESYLKSYNNDLKCDSENTIKLVRDIEVGNNNATATLILDSEEDIGNYWDMCDAYYLFELKKTEQGWNVVNYTLDSCGRAQFSKPDKEFIQDLGC